MLLTYVSFKHRLDKSNWKLQNIQGIFLVAVAWKTHTEMVKSSVQRFDN